MTTRWRPNHKVTYNKWKDCQRCSLPWPESDLRLQWGVRVCPECYDDLGHKDIKKESPSEPRLPKVWEPD